MENDRATGRCYSTNLRSWYRNSQPWFGGAPDPPILFINNDGGGFVDHVDVAAGVTVAEFFGQRMPGRQPEDYLIRVNRLPAAAGHALRDGDRK
jgi:hypothetical protein